MEATTTTTATTTSSTLNIKSEDLNEAIRKAAQEHLLKRRQTPAPITTAPGLVSQSMKSELERALDARLRRSSMIAAVSGESTPTSTTTSTPAVKDLPPPPSPHSLHRLTNASPSASSSSSSSSIPPPPPPPIPCDLFNSTASSSSTPSPSTATAATTATVVSKTHVVATAVRCTPTTSTPSHNIGGGVRSIVNSMHSMATATDPRLSSDFSALIGTNF